MRPAISLIISLVGGCGSQANFPSCNEGFPSRGSERLPEGVVKISGVATTDEGEELPFQVEARMKKGKPWRTVRPERVLEGGLAVCLAGAVLEREADLAVTVQLRGQDYTWMQPDTKVVVEDGGSGIELDTAGRWPWPQVVGPLRDVLLEAKGAQNNDLPPTEGGLYLLFAAGSDRQEDRGFLDASVSGEGGRTGDWSVLTMLSTLEFHEP